MISCARPRVNVGGRGGFVGSADVEAIIRAGGRAERRGRLAATLGGGPAATDDDAAGAIAAA